MKKYTFSQGPKVSVTLEFEDNIFKHAILAFADKFTCILKGDAEAAVKDPLLAFIESYGKKTPIAVPLSLDHFTTFRQKVLKCLQEIPFGEVLTYGELASAAGHPKAARAVGSTCHFNPFPLFIPCHRVIASGNRLGGFAYDLAMKKKLLDFES